MLIRLVIADTLREAGYLVLEAATADEAHELISAGLDVDLLITDVRMPGQRDGLALAREMATERPGLPVLISSADTHSGDYARAFLPKPYSSSRLLDVVAELLRTR